MCRESSAEVGGGRFRLGLLLGQFVEALPQKFFLFLKQFDVSEYLVEDAVYGC